ncbi:MAG: putative thymidylate synthase [Candidatus Saccharibacteria bacterium]|nr:putative thymidylate synthase [Candidatus Saccharibacteria bacterium]
MNEKTTPSTNGRYIVIEGAEGVGKTTQLTMLGQRLEKAGYPVRLFREPDSQSDLTARAIRMLTQDPRYPMNTRTEVLLYNAARSQSLEVIKRARDAGVICLCDRNYLTTLAIQYYGRGDVPDYDTINSIISFAVADMQPDMTIVLDAPVQDLKKRSENRNAGERFDNLDEAFLERVRAGYLWEAKQRGFSVISAINSPEEVNEEIWKILNGAAQTPTAETNEPPMLTSASAATTPAASIKEVIEAKIDHLEEKKKLEFLKKDKAGHFKITADGKEFLNDAVTTSDGDVYAFTDKLSPTTIAAAMARLSRRGDDMRVTLLDEFAASAGKDAKLLQRVITAYGDDSVQQLVGIHVVVENASNLLTKKLEWGRLAAYLEQSTRYIYFDQKDQHGKYRYFTPADLPLKLKDHYEEVMDKIFDIYSDMVHKLTDYVRDHSSVPEAERDGAFNGATRAQACDAIRAVLPVAVKSTVGIYASGQALESLIMHLQSDNLPEARKVGDDLLREARKTVPTFLERADKPDRGGAMVAYRSNTYNAMKRVADEQLKQNLGSLDEDIQLVDYWPRNELDLLPHMLYEHSTMSLKDIKKEIQAWPYEQKLAAFRTYMGERLNRRHKPGRALEAAHYSWDLLCDYGIFRDLQRHRMVDAFDWQQLTPRYGFDMPELVEQAGLSDQFEQCFDLSAALYSQLQAEGFALEAQYATLLGHRMRWKIIYNAREAFHFHELRTAPQGHPGYRKLVKEMHDKVAEIHPLLTDAMIFVNRDEDEELTRLAAEKYTQFKLSQLS